MARRSWIENGMPSTGIPNIELLLEKYPDSRHVPAAQALLAEQALTAKEYDTALIYAQSVLDNAAEISIVIDATFIRAEALRNLNRGGEAIADYNAILANRAAPAASNPKPSSASPPATKAKKNTPKPSPTTNASTSSTAPTKSRHQRLPPQRRLL